MKKFLFIALTSALLASCQNNISDSDNNQNTPPQNQTVTLQSRLQSAEPGTIIDLESEKLSVTENDSYTIDKALTIKNGDLHNATFSVNATGVKFENITNISSITVSEKVGEGDFSLNNCSEIAEVYVNGGGQNSIYIEKTKVSKLIIRKKNVRIVLKGGDKTSVEKNYIFADCTLESETASKDDNQGSSFGTVIVDEVVKELNLAGNVVVKRINSVNPASQIKITITVNVTINSADNIIKNGLQYKDESAVDTTKLKDSEIPEEEKAEFDKISEKFDKIPENGDFFSNLNFTSSIKEIVTVEKNDDEFVIKNANAEPFYNNNIWNYWVITEGKLPVEKGKNYKISVDLKSDKECIVFIDAKEGASDEATHGVYVYPGTEYKTYTVETGTIGDYGWIEGKFLIAVGCAEVVYVKNFKITPIEKDAIPVAYWSYNEDELENMSVTGTSNGAELIFTTESEQLENCRGVDVVLSKNELQCGKSYLINFDITSDVTIEAGDLGVWARTGNYKNETTGSSTIFLNAGEKKNIELFVHAYQLDDETFRIPCICICTRKKCTLKVENIKTIETTKEEYFQKYPSASLYFAGNINDNWITTKDLETGVFIPADGEVYFEMVYASSTDESNPYNSLEPLPLLIRVPQSDLLIQKKYKVEKREIDKLYFKNQKTEPVMAKFILTDDFKVDVTLSEPDYNSLVGIYDGTAYLDLEKWSNFKCDIGFDEINGDWYKATYTIDSVKVRDENLDYYVFIVTSSWAEETKTFTHLCESNLRISDEPQVIEKIIKVPENSWVSSEIQGKNVIAKIKDIIYEKIPEPSLSNSWYYTDVNKSLLPEGATKLNYIFNNNNGIQSFDADFELTDKSVYCFKFGDSYREYQNGDRKYRPVVSERTDNPTTEPDEGFIRLYFYSELPETETPYAYLWTSGTNQVEVKNEDGTITYEREFWQNNAWPGNKMIKFE